MKLCQALLDDRINDKTLIIIRDESGRAIRCGRWYQDKILYWCRFEVSFNFVEDRNIAIMQLL